MMESFSALHEYDLEIRLHQPDRYQTLAFCWHVFFVTSFSPQDTHATTWSAISPQMHHQNPADASPESRGTTRIRRTPTESYLHLQYGYIAWCWRDIFIKMIFQNSQIHVDTLRLCSIIQIIIILKIYSQNVCTCISLKMRKLHKEHVRDDTT